MSAGPSPISAKSEQFTKFGTGGPAARAQIERAVSPAVSAAIAVALGADGAGAAIETARAVMRAASRELANHAGPAAAAEEVYRAADDILSSEVRAMPDSLITTPRRWPGHSHPGDHIGVALAVMIAGSQSALARLSGLSRSVIWRLLTHRQKPSREHALAIEAATAYMVPRYRLRPDLWAGDGV